jgi:hypothetical protein
VAGVATNVAHRGRGSIREHCPIGWFQIQTFDVTTQHRDLVAQDKDFDLLRPLAPHA